MHAKLELKQVVRHWLGTCRAGMSYDETSREINYSQKNGACYNLEEKDCLNQGVVCKWLTDRCKPRDGQSSSWWEDGTSKLNDGIESHFTHTLQVHHVVQNEDVGTSANISIFKVGTDTRLMIFPIGESIMMPEKDVDFCVQFANRLRDNLILAGHSMGGLWAQQVAVKLAMSSSRIVSRCWCVTTGVKAWMSPAQFQFTFQYGERWKHWIFAYVQNNPNNVVMDNRALLTACDSSGAQLEGARITSFDKLNPGNASSSSAATIHGLPGAHNWSRFYKPALQREFNIDYRNPVQYVGKGQEYGQEEVSRMQSNRTRPRPPPSHTDMQRTKRKKIRAKHTDGIDDTPRCRSSSTSDVNKMCKLLSGAGYINTTWSILFYCPDRPTFVIIHFRNRRDFELITVEGIHIDPTTGRTRRAQNKEIPDALALKGWLAGIGILSYKWIISKSDVFGQISSSMLEEDNLVNYLFYPSGGDYPKKILIEGLSNRLGRQFTHCDIPNFNNIPPVSSRSLS